MPLTLPGGVLLPDEEAITTVLQYLDENEAVFALYDATNSGDHDEVTATDLLSLNALNAYRGPVPVATVMTSMWLERADVALLVQQIPTAKVEELTDAERARILPLVCNALRRAERVRYFGGGGTRVAKLLHRLRPGLIPIWDVRVGEWYGGPRQTWTSFISDVWGDVTTPENASSLAAIRHATIPSLTPLRVWDILLWMRVGAAQAA